MQFTSIAILAATAATSSGAVMRRTASYAPFVIEDFAASHQPHGSLSTVSFYLSNSDPKIDLAKTECVAQDSGTSINEFGNFPSWAKCTDERAEFTFNQTETGQWTLKVYFTADPQRPVVFYEGYEHYFPKSAIGYIEDPPNSGETWETLSAPAKFEMTTLFD